MNNNGTLPWARFEALWAALYHAGDVERAFNPKRFAAIRNHLSSLVVDGEVLLEWEDETYSAERACKWRASEKLMNMMEQEREENPLPETCHTILADLPRPRPAGGPRKCRGGQTIRLIGRVLELYRDRQRLAA
jgi:hypothetical protein